MDHSVSRKYILCVSFVISRWVEHTSAAAKLYRSFVIFDNSPYTRNTIQRDTLRSAAPQAELVKFQLVCAIGISIIAFRDFHSLFRGWWGVEALQQSYIDRSSESSIMRIVAVSDTTFATRTRIQPPRLLDQMRFQHM